MNNSQTTYSAVLGSIVANNRKAIGLEQSDMAAALNISQASYSRLESGRSSMTTDQIFLVCKGLNMKTSGLFSALEKSIAALEANGCSVIPQLRGKKSDAGLVIGAGLGALLLALLAQS